MYYVTPTISVTQNDWKATAGHVALLLLIATGVWFRLSGLEWGIPRALPPDSTTYRNSYHIDEDDYLRGLMNTKPQAWDFDVRDYHWGTLQFYLIGGALAVAEASGYLAHPWRETFLTWNPRDFGRLYAAGRAVSALAGLLTLAAVFAFGRSLKNLETGLGAAALVAVSPLHVVNSHFLTSDISMVFLLTVSLYFFVSSLGKTTGGHEKTSAFFLGLAVSAKYNAAFLLPLWVARDLGRRVSWKSRASVYAAMAAGFGLGEPYVFVHPIQVADSVYHAHFMKSATMNLLPWWKLLLEQGCALARFGLQWTILVPAALGLVLCLVYPSKKKMALAASVVLMTASLVPARWPMMRYTLPLVPLAALAASLLISELRVRPWFRPWTVGLIALVPLLVSWAHVGLLVGEHPANLASDWIRANVVPAGRIGQIWPEIPPLDPHWYDVRALHGLFAGDPARPRDLDREYLVLDDLPIEPFSPEFRARLERDFALLVEFRSDPRVGPWLLGEEGAPHDWKYTHPVVRIYGRKRDVIDSALQ